MSESVLAVRELVVEGIMGVMANAAKEGCSRSWLIGRFVPTQSVLWSTDYTLCLSTRGRLWGPQGLFFDPSWAH